MEAPGLTDHTSGCACGASVAQHTHTRCVLEGCCAPQPSACNYLCKCVCELNQPQRQCSAVRAMAPADRGCLQWRVSKRPACMHACGVWLACAAGFGALRMRPSAALLRRHCGACVALLRSQQAAAAWTEELRAQVRRPGCSHPTSLTLTCSLRCGHACTNRPAACVSNVTASLRCAPREWSSNGCIGHIGAALD